MQLPVIGKERPAAVKHIALVGHTGRMGSMLLGAWRAAGFHVEGVQSLPGTPLDGDAVARAGIVMLAVPAGCLCEVMGRIAPFLGPEQLLMDITSVKVMPMLIMQEFHSGPVIGSHPLFGPAPAGGDMRAVLVKGRRCTDALAETAEALFTAIGATVFWAGAREHDHGVAFAQSLNFAMSTAFFSTMTRHRECLPFLTPSFKRHMEAARKHLTQDRAMFCEFTAHNPCFHEAVQAYCETLEQTLSNLPGLAEEAAVWFDSAEERRYLTQQEASKEKIL